MHSRIINPDVTQRDDAPYWAAALVLAIKSKDRGRVEKAQRELERLGFNLQFGLGRPQKRPAIAKL